MSTPALRIHYHPASYNARRALAVAFHVGAPVEIVICDLMAGAQGTPAFRALNPNGLVPVLEDGDFVLWESMAIAQYLADKYPSSAWPADARARADITRWQAWDLAHFGRAPFFRYFERAQSTDETIEELVVAAGSLASRKIGAIIVLERQIGLRNYIEGGIPLDAMVTYDLLACIFQRGSPLHDGAAIIQGDRVAAAACFLPLSVNPKVSRELGTRHRAALGLTEENDAVAIVVSEESGGISLVIGGGLERGISTDALKTRLRSLAGRRRKRVIEGEKRRSLA